LVYPIIFLYRHHIELALKRMILRAPYLIERDLTEAEKQHLGKHRLDLLWQDLKPMLATICEAADREMDSEDIEGIEDYIGQLMKLDPDSYSFRYAQSKKGAPSLPDDLMHINVRHFAGMMDRLGRYLSGIEAATDHLEELKSDWYSDMASYVDW